MKTLSLITVLLVSLSAWSAPKPTTAKPTGTKTSSKVGTNHQFDGALIGGKNQVPMEALTEVENEKAIDDLIGIRKNFSDRAVKAKGLR